MLLPNVSTLVKTLVEPIAIHHADAFELRNYFSISAEVSVHVLSVI